MQDRVAVLSDERWRVGKCASIRVVLIGGARGEQEYGCGRDKRFRAGARDVRQFRTFRFNSSNKLSNTRVRTKLRGRVEFAVDPVAIRERGRELGGDLGHGDKMLQWEQGGEPGIKTR